MGKKGAKLSTDADAASALLVETLANVGEVTRRKMFGGFGIFESGTMFGIVDSGGQVFFRAGPGNQQLFDQAGSKQHGKMPYYSVPDSVLGVTSELEAWVAQAFAASRDAIK